MKLSKPETLGGGWRVSPIVVQSGFAAYAQCWADVGGARLRVAELLSYQQALTAIIAVVALVMSFLSLRRTSRVQDQQLRLHRKQEELTDLQLEALRRQAEAGKVAATPVQGTADVRVDLEQVGRDYKFIITNWGSASARDVTFDLELPEGSRSPLVRGDYDAKIPIPELAPGSRVPLFAAITFGIGSAFPARWSWLNPDDTRQTRKSMIAW
jgi:hypothetical protein